METTERFFKEEKRMTAALVRNIGKVVSAYKRILFNQISFSLFSKNSNLKRQLAFISQGLFTCIMCMAIVSY